MAERFSLETVVELLLRTESAVKALETKIDDQRAEYVSSAAWVQRNGRVDLALKTIEDDVAEIKADLRAKRTPWPAVASAVVATGALLLSLMQAVR